jgi:hypothetical protein
MIRGTRTSTIPNPAKPHVIMAQMLKRLYFSRQHRTWEENRHGETFCRRSPVRVGFIKSFSLLTPAPDASNLSDWPLPSLYQRNSL